jgi:hypothetical protein
MEEKKIKKNKKNNKDKYVFELHGGMVRRSKAWLRNRI